jgi:hypothetical protein
VGCVEASSGMMLGGGDFFGPCEAPRMSFRMMYVAPWIIWGKPRWKIAGDIEVLPCRWASRECSTKTRAGGTWERLGEDAKVAFPGMGDGRVEERRVRCRVLQGDLVSC